MMVRVYKLMSLLCLVASCDIGEEAQNTAPLATWTIAGAPSLVIDAHADEPFYNVRDVAASGDRIAVADAGNYAVAVFDGSGHYLHTLGRKGAGPGEFESVSDVFLLADDSVLAFDGRLNRFQVFDRGGRYSRGFTFSTRDDGTATSPGAVLSSGVIVGRSLRLDNDPPAPSDVTRATADVMRFAMDGSMLDTVAIVPSWEAFNTRANGVFMANIPIPFGHSTFMDGAGDHFVLAASDSNALRVYSAEGTLLHTVQRAAAPGPAVKPEEVEAVKQQAIERSPPGMRQRLEVVYAEMPYPETKPPFSWVYAGADSSVWLRLPQVTPGEETFMIFDGRGAAAAMLKLPDALSPMDVSRESIVGVWTDSLGVESVRVFRVSH